MDVNYINIDWNALSITIITTLSLEDVSLGEESFSTQGVQSGETGILLSL